MAIPVPYTALASDPSLKKRQIRHRTKLPAAVAPKDRCAQALAPRSGVRRLGEAWTGNPGAGPWPLGLELCGRGEDRFARVLGEAFRKHL